MTTCSGWGVLPDGKRCPGCPDCGFKGGRITNATPSKPAAGKFRNRITGEMTSKRRLGKFTMQRDMVIGPHAPEIFRRLSFVPLRVEAMDYANVYEYIGLSPLFDKIDIYTMMVPEYIIIIHTEKGKLISVDVESL